MNISIIVAIARNHGIGFENKLLYWLPNDLKRFKALTTGHTIIMGSAPLGSDSKVLRPMMIVCPVVKALNHFPKEHFPIAGILY